MLISTAVLTRVNEPRHPQNIHNKIWDIRVLKKIKIKHKQTKTVYFANTRDIRTYSSGNNVPIRIGNMAIYKY